MKYGVAGSTRGGFQLSGFIGLTILYGFALLPFNVAPLLIGTLVTDLGISESVAGLLISAELIMMAVTVMALSARIDAVPIKKLLTTMTIVLGAAHVLSSVPDSFGILLCLRLVAGVAGGTLLACVFYLAGISTAPVRAFGILTVANVIFGTVFLALLPLAVEAWQYRGGYAVLAVPMLLGVFFLRYIARPDGADTHAKAEGVRGIFGPMAWVFILAVFLVQAAQGGYFAFVELAGRELAIDPVSIGATLALSYLLGLVGSSVAGIVGDRFGVLGPLLLGMAGHCIAVVYAMLTTSTLTYQVAVNMQAFAFFLFLPFMLGLASKLDRSGLLSTMTGGVVMFGLGVGPFFAGSAVELSGFSIIGYGNAVAVVIASVLLVIVDRRPRRSSLPATTE